MEIAAYMFKADFYCPECIIGQLPTGEGETFDGWALTNPAEPMPVEENLDELAAAFVIDRSDEFSFDTDYFPKRVYADMLDGPEHCGKCERSLP